MRLNLKLKDWQERALKTFVQTFGGVVVPEVVLILNNIETVKTFGAAWTLLFPAICSGIAAGICAVWNIFLGVSTPPAVPCEASAVVQEGDDGGDV